MGNLFALSKELLGHVDAIYDRAALVALPEPLRKQYTQHLLNITGTASQLLICYEYDQALMAGPQFAISREEMNQHYRAHYDLTLVDSLDVVGGLKG